MRVFEITAVSLLHGGDMFAKQRLMTPGVHALKLEFANDVSIVFGTQIVVGVKIDVLADEAARAISKQKLSTTNVSRLEAEFVGPVIPPLAA